MKDIEGKELEIGDRVLFTYAGENSLYLCEVERFTPRMVYLKSLIDTWYMYMQCKTPETSIYKINK